MTPDQLDELARRYRDATFAGETMPLQLAENALCYVAHHPSDLLPAEVAELLLSALSRLHQVERAARALVTGLVPIEDGYEMVRDALRARMSNSASLDDEARR